MDPTQEMFERALRAAFKETAWYFDAETTEEQQEAAVEEALAEQDMAYFFQALYHQGYTDGVVDCEAREAQERG